LSQIDQILINMININKINNLHKLDY